MKFLRHKKKGIDAEDILRGRMNATKRRYHKPRTVVTVPLIYGHKILDIVDYDADIISNGTESATDLFCNKDMFRPQ